MRCSGSINPALSSSNEYSISSGASLIRVVATEATDCGAGVVLAYIGIDGVEGVEGSGNFIVLRAMLASSSTAETVLEGVRNEVLLSIVFCAISVCVPFMFSNLFAALAFDDPLDDIGEKGLRDIGDDWASWALKKCLFTGRSAISKPFLPKIMRTENWKIVGQNTKRRQGNVDCHEV